MAYAPAYPHDPVEEIASDLFMVRGSIRMNMMGRITRNMAVVCHEGELTLVNPIRLTPEGESQLKALGEIKRIMRLGPFHGLDDPYYVNEYNTEFWCQPGGEAYPEPPVDKPMSADGALPFPEAELFCFETTTQPECALLMKRSGVLLTCDAIQHYGDYKHNSPLFKLMMPLMGFPKRTVVGPFWLKFLTPEGGSLKAEFERLLTLEFDALLSAHGSFLPSGAHDSLERAVQLAFKT